VIPFSRHVCNRSHVCYLAVDGRLVVWRLDGRRRLSVLKRRLPIAFVTVQFFLLLSESSPEVRAGGGEYHEVDDAYGRENRYIEGQIGGGVADEESRKMGWEGGTGLTADKARLCFFA